MTADAREERRPWDYSPVMKHALGVRGRYGAGGGLGVGRLVVVRQGTRATNPTPPTAQGIGPSADQGAAARDMPGGGRGQHDDHQGK